MAAITYGYNDLCQMLYSFTFEFFSCYFSQNIFSGLMSDDPKRPLDIQEFTRVLQGEAPEEDIKKVTTAKEHFPAQNGHQ